MNKKASSTALMSSFGRAFHAENEEYPVFADDLAKELMTAEEYTAVQSYILGGAQFFEPEIDLAQQMCIRDRAYRGQPYHCDDDAVLKALQASKKRCV